MQRLLPSGSKIIAMRQTGVASGSMRNFTSRCFKCATAASKSSAYTTGWDCLPDAASTHRALASEAIALGRVLVQLLPGEPEALGLLALMFPSAPTVNRACPLLPSALLRV